MFVKSDKNVIRKKRHLRVRKAVFGAPERPRLNVYRSARHIYTQIIDDVNGRTLVSASTLAPDFTLEQGGNLEAAKMIGQLIAQKALAAGINQVVFDRGGYLYHGRVAALAAAAREAGLEF
ncbi:MAG: large subunit ribosomal protein L18 [Bacillota bacterium]|nr:MAG: large subunit ribosomal protein L18 [Bacillota bacterium]MBS3950455.1 50S ribosomal protein L18 [Peptococcaceae bacterium]